MCSKVSTRLVPPGPPDPPPGLPGGPSPPRFCDLLTNSKEENCDDNKVVDTRSAMDNTAVNNTHFFEGVEKNLEVWFTNSSGDIGQSDLRLIPR